jgi:DNA polymerase III delta subunit
MQQRLGDVYQDDIAEYLLAYVGNDSSRLSLECDKIRTYMHQMQITKISTETLHSIVYSSLAVNNFAILDALCAGDLTNTMTCIDEAVRDQTSRNECIGMMYR